MMSTGLIVEPQRLAIAQERVGGPRVGWRGLLVSVRRAHAILHGLLSDDRGALGSIGDIPGHVCAGDRYARGPQLQVPARVVRMHMRVDDVLQRFSPATIYGWPRSLYPRWPRDRYPRSARPCRPLEPRCCRPRPPACRCCLAPEECELRRRWDRGSAPCSSRAWAVTSSSAKGSVGAGGRVLDDLLELRIHCLRSAQRRDQRQVVHVRVLGDERILARQIIRTAPLGRPLHFFHFLARIQPVSGGIGVKCEVLGFHQRFGEVHGIGSRC